MTAEDRQGLVASEEEVDEVEDVEDILQSPIVVRPESQSVGLVYVASGTAALGGLIFGYDVGIIAGARAMVAQELDLLCSQEELLVSLMPLGAVCSCLVSGRLLDSLGRKLTIQFTCLVFLAGSLLLSLAHSLPLLLVGRWLVGCGVSLSAISESCYISEIAAASVRGRLVTLNELGITLGFLLAFIVNFIFADVTGGWRIMFGLSSVFAIVQFFLMIFMPESPHYLIRAGRDLKAISVLKKIHCVSGVTAQREVTKIKTEQRLQSSTPCHLMCSTEDNIRSRLLLGLGLVLAQQLCGQPNVMYYAADIAQSVGFCGETLSGLATILLGFVKVVATVISLLLVDRVGRRPLLIAGVGIIIISLLCLAITSTYQEVHTGFVSHQACYEYQTDFNSSSNETSCLSEMPKHVSYVSFVSLVAYITAYSISFGPITWILLSEVFPLSLKARAISLGQAVNWTANALVSVTFLDLVHTFTLPAVFTGYLLMSVLSLAFIYFYVPETKNKSLEQISYELRQESPGYNKRKTLSPLPAVSASRSSNPPQLPLQVFHSR